MRRAGLLCCMLCCTGILAVTRPPGVYIQPRHDVFFKPGETVEMPCVADGIPNPRYTWKRDGIKFDPSGNDDRIVQLPNVGTIRISRPEDKDEGIFQCFAENDYGKSATIKINLRQAKLKDFDVEPVKSFRPYLGESLTLNCVPPESIPPSEVFWVIKEQNAGFTPINFDARVTMDHESRLRFTNIKANDSQDGKAYACMAMNKIVRKSTLGGRQFIQPMGSSEVQRQVTYMWASPSDQYGLRGDEFRIKCIFAGNPTPDVHWLRTDGVPLPDHVKQSSFGQELLFSSLEYSDAGDYECWATNDQSPQRVQRTISVRVQSRPFWIEEPKDVELGIGGTARFKCLAGGDPTPLIYWYINSVPLGQANMNSQFKKVSADEVMMVNVTKEDAMVIQCNVTNRYGYIWGDVYLNVLLETPVPVFSRTENTSHNDTAPASICPTSRDKVSIGVCHFWMMAGQIADKSDVHPGLEEGDEHAFRGDWGEQLVDKHHPVPCVIDVRSGEVTVLDHHSRVSNHCNLLGYHLLQF